MKKILILLVALSFLSVDAQQKKKKTTKKKTKKTTAVAEKQAASEITPLDLIINGKKIYFNQSDLYEIFKENQIIQRLFATFLIQFNREFFFNNINTFDCKKLIDILWYQRKDDIDFIKIK